MWKVEARLYRSNFKHKTRLPVEMIRAFAERRFREGIDVLLLGHFHRSWTEQVGRGRVEILPAFVDERRWMEIADDGSTRLWTLGSEGVRCRCQVSGTAHGPCLALNTWHLSYLTPSLMTDYLAIPPAREVRGHRRRSAFEERHQPRPDPGGAIGNGGRDRTPARVGGHAGARPLPDGDGRE